MESERAPASLDGGPILGLEPRFYTDATIFALERERIFLRTWQYACHQREFAAPGDFVVFDVADQSLFVIRDGVDSYAAFTMFASVPTSFLRGWGIAAALPVPTMPGPMT